MQRSLRTRVGVVTDTWDPKTPMIDSGDPSPVLPPVAGSWQQSDSRGAAAFAQARDRAKARDWSSTVNGGSPVTDLRALTIHSSLNFNSLSDVGPDSSQGKIIVTDRASKQFKGLTPNQALARQELAVAPMRAMTVLSTAMLQAEYFKQSSAAGLEQAAVKPFDVNPYFNSSIITANDSAPSMAPASAQVLGYTRVGSVALYIIAGLTVVAVAYIGFKTLDNELTRSNTRKAILDGVNGLNEISDKHLQAEKDAGHPLPMNAAETAAINTLGASTKELAHAEGVSSVITPIPSIIPDIPGLTKGLVKGATDVTTILAFGTIAVGALFVLTSGKK